jgi:hypothetical protein
MQEKAKHKKQVPEAQKILLGIMGERIVASILRKAGHIVEESLNVFDSEKDMLVDEKPVEVKTQVPFIIEDSFAVPPHQIKKMMNCDRVYFVCVPVNKPDDLAGGVFEMNPKDDVKAHRRTLHNGETVVCFPRRQMAMKMIHQISDPGILKQLRTLSTSYL